jgi:hypothetical protein
MGLDYYGPAPYPSKLGHIHLSNKKLFRSFKIKHCKERMWTMSDDKAY